jgi:hypothetical protein
MSWDVVICHTAGNPITSGGLPLAMGSGRSVIEKLSSVWPGIVWNGLSTGIFQSADYSVEFSLSYIDVQKRMPNPFLGASVKMTSPAQLYEGITLDSEVQNISLGVHGGRANMGDIVRFCKLTGWQAIDCQTTELLNLDNPCSDSPERWQNLRDRIR